VKRHKTFLVLVSNPFFWIGYTFYLIFGFRLSVRNGFLYFVFGFSFFIFYFNFILANRLASPFLFGPLFFILASPFYSVIKDQFILFLFVIHSLLLLLLLQVVLVKSSSSVVVRRLFVPAKCVRIMKICKTHMINAIILL